MPGHHALGTPRAFARFGNLPFRQRKGTCAVKFGAGVLIGIAIGVILVIWLVLRLVF
ncbi:MAG TPA: hypothetical protein VKB09_10385 [Thermomicrobiales bacterium]|nr:hypothetical protein [Thermomicrobiales bacterium]